MALRVADHSLPGAGPTSPVHPTARFDAIVDQVAEQGYAVCPEFLPDPAVFRLLARSQLLVQNRDVEPAGIGRGPNHQTNRQVRRDHIHWLGPEDPDEAGFLGLMGNLRLAINRSLFAGLFDYEAHFAWYPKGGFYRRHVDAFRGRTNRRLSTVLYLNFGWEDGSGGELRMYDPDVPENVLFELPPRAGTLVVFDSERFWHEVLPAERERFSIAGWFRVNASTHWRPDPPR